MVKVETPPNKSDLELYPIRILHNACTLADATAKFELLAIKSTAESNCASDGDKDSSSDDNPEPTPKTVRTSPKKKKKGTTQKPPEGSSFEFTSDHENDISNNGMNFGGACSPLVSTSGGKKSSPLVSQASGRNSPVKTLPCLKSANSSNLFSSSSIKKNLFSGESSSTFLTKDQFEAFERRMFLEVNRLMTMVEEGFANIKTHTPSQRLISLPATISSRCSLPATDVHNLEELDSVLKTSEIKTELATYLAQLGGKNHADFLGRVLPKVISDQVCCYTNWSGSAVAPGSVDSEGHEITREFKKTFSNLTHIVDMFCVSSRMACPSTTDKEVESFIKKWLLSYKDRLLPRSHQKSPNSGQSPRKKKSPKKKR